MKLEDTVEMMKSDDFKERFKAEYYQVKIRADKLALMLEKYKSGTLPFEPKCSYELLFAQLVHMCCYMQSLEKRAEIEEIDLN